MKNSVEPKSLEILDIKLLRYIGKRRVKKEKLFKKFGAHRIHALSKHTLSNPALIYEEFNVERKKSGYPPPHDNLDEMIGLGIYALTPEGVNALENNNAATQKEWIKFYIPISISILSLIVALLSFLRTL